MIYTNEQLDNAFATLPEKLQDYILSQETQKAIDYIVAQHNIPNIDSFKQEILSVLVGLQSTDSFVHSISKDFSISEERALNILVTTDEMILEQAQAIVEEMDDYVKYTQDSATPLPQTPAYSAFSQAAQPKPSFVSVPKITSVEPTPIKPVPLIAPAQKSSISAMSTPIQSSQAPAPFPPAVPPKPVALNMIDSKLQAPTSIQKQETNVEETKPQIHHFTQEAQKQNYPTKDPYREPIE